MLKNDIVAFAHEIAKKATDVSGLEYEMYASWGDSFQVKVVDGQIDNYSVHDFIGISLRVKYEGKMGYASTTSPDASYAGQLLEKAIENAKITESPDEQFIYGGDKEYPKVLTSKAALDSVTSAEKIEMAKEMEKYALSHSDMIIRTMGSYVISESSHRMIYNSNGLDVSESSEYIVAYVVPIAKKGDEMNSGFAYTAGFDKESLDIKKAAEEAAEDAIRFCGAGSCDGGNMKTVIDAKAVCELLSTFSGIFSSDNTQRGLSLLAGKEGEKIASEKINITDKPVVDLSFGSRSFDDEGVASQNTVIIEKGELKTLLYNLKTAKKAGRKTTANACKGSYSSPVAVSFSNFILESGTLTKDEIVQKAQNGVMLTSLEGLHAGANVTTGDFSLSAQGILIKDGKLDRPVTGMTVSGNIYELLKNVQEVGNDVYTDPFGFVISCPSILLEKPLPIAAEGENGND